jgi:hypothetical protein
MDFDKIIREAFIEYYKTVTTDQYGQVGINKLEVYQVFSKLNVELRKKLNQFIKEGKSALVGISLYGGRLGTYEAMYFKDNEFQKEVHNVLRTNKNYLHNMNSW